MNRARVVILHGDSGRAGALAVPLRAAGIEVLPFSSAPPALAAARAGADAVILDVDTAGDPGAAVRAFSGDPVVRLIPLLALAERPLAEEEVASALSAGATDVLVKPYGFSLLVARVGNMVRIHREEIALRETEERYRRIFASSHYGYFLSSRDGRFLDVNDALLNILGYSSRDEILRLRIPEDLYVDPEDRKVLMAMIEKRGFVKDFKVDFKRRDGSSVSILLTANRYTSPDGMTEGFEGFNIPLLDLELAYPRWVPRPLMRVIAKLTRRRGSRLSVSRISELVANQYEKVEELSEGFYSSVWKGRDVLGFEQSPLVIKVSKSEVINARLLAEAQALRRLAGHPAIPELVDVARHRGRTVVVTRFVEGKPLSALLPLRNDRERDRIAYQLADAVAHLHDLDVVHRDIKPSNVIVRPDGRIVLIDYGIVRQLGELETSSTVIGTRPYMSPEQVNGRSERRSDVWALGVVLYQMYTERLPFDGATEMELMENILSQEPVVPRALKPDLPAKFETVLLKALRKRPEGRYGSAAEMRDDLLAGLPQFRANVEDLIHEGKEPVVLVP